MRLNVFSIEALVFVRALTLSAALLILCGCATPSTEGPAVFQNFETRCAQPKAIRCFGFERDELATMGGPIHWGHARKPVGVFVNGKPPSASLAGRVELSSEHAASGNSSLKFFMPGRSGAGHAGQFYANFSDDLSVQFGEGDEFYVQWRQRFSPAFVTNRYVPFNSWKQVIIGEGSRPGVHARSCTQLELVVNNKQGSPAMYHSCRGKDGRSEAIPGRGSVPFVADEWMTFQVRVKIGTWYQNDRRYRNDSIVELWVARAGEPSRRVVSQTYDLANTDPDTRYGKVWLLPYLTAKRATQEHPDAFTWYDELIISTSRIADPEQ